MRFGLRYLFLICFTFALQAAEKDPLLMKDPDWIDGRMNDIDHGKFVHFSYSIPKRPVPKGIAIKVGGDEEGTVCFDTLLCSYAGAWTGGFVEFSSRRFGLTGGTKIIGDLLFHSGTRPGWAKDEKFDDPRERRTMPLPADWARYEGMYRNGDRSILKYTVSGTPVFDLPGIESKGKITAITRTLEIAPSKNEMRMLIASHEKSKVTRFDKSGVKCVQLERGGSVLSAGVVGVGASVIPLGRDHLVLRIPAHKAVLRLKVLVWKGTKERLPEFSALVKGSPDAEAISRLARSGFKTLWNEKIETRGRVGLSLGPFAIDTITLPFKNPYNALLFAGGHDFLANGDALLATAHGDVWLVKGIDARLEKITWQRFATGLYQPLGLKVVDDRIYVLGKDQITELEDLNGDGEADYYRNFNNQNEISGPGHNYATCLETDPDGNFWFIRCNDRTPHGGTLLKVKHDGSDIEVMATGFRNPNGMGVSPTGVVTAADQQGGWVPETRLDVTKKGGFYGFVPSSKRTPDPASYDGPLCWVPRALDNSAGGQTWVPRGSWGPFSEQMIHISYGRCRIMAVLRDEATGGANGGMVSIPGRFDSGVMRGRFHTDGHLYLSGLMGWQTVGLADGAFQRIRYTGRNLFVPSAFSSHKNGIRLTFNEPLQKELAEDTGSYNAEMWNYLWSKAYGSDDYSVNRPGEKGRDALEVKSAKLLQDGKSVFLEIPGIRKAHQFALEYNLTSAKGLKKKDTFYATLNELGPSR
ncbi:MAG: hypothetical protein CMO80_14220 [Verrucomicrobiales bacterium]|nr:hypothetical protein [Verrucomicrobiales bacterium]|tara:strand:+ start:4136 stop:6394 length:2259 start_codon:yes stop_codon:yes gene_type:complete